MTIQRIGIKAKSPLKTVCLSLILISMMTCLFSLSGCAWISSKYKQFKGTLIGNQYTIDTFDNFGKLSMSTHGKKISIEGNYINETEDSQGTLSSVITINIDGEQIITAGNTMIFYEDGLKPEYNWSIENISSSSNPLDLTDNALLAGKVNAVKNVFGKDRIVVIQSQTGAPIYAFSGDKVYWEITEDLPKFTRLNIDGKQMYIHRANFQIIDQSLLKD